MCLTITTNNNWSHLVSVCYVLDIDERALPVSSHLFFRWPVLFQA